MQARQEQQRNTPTQTDLTQHSNARSSKHHLTTRRGSQPATRDPNRQPQLPVNQPQSKQPTNSLAAHPGGISQLQQGRDQRAHRPPASQPADRYCSQPQPTGAAGPAEATAAGCAFRNEPAQWLISGRRRPRRSRRGPTAPAGQDRAGQDRAAPAGRDKTGQDRTGQGGDRAGAAAGRRRPRVRTGQGRTVQGGTG